MRFDCSEYLLLASEILIDGHPWVLHITCVAHFDAVSERSLEALKQRVKPLVSQEDLSHLLRFYLMVLSKTTKRAVGVWEAINEESQGVDRVEELVVMLQRNLALEAVNATITSNKTLTLAFQLNFDTILTFHKTFIPHALFVPDSPL